ncbi:Ger(x)C family spore germination protein [Paenibacillus lignilyticus]|uniref:Ger(X)C family spore germination protein n=1 Tax=Paenibacillus lignilyticus TaxID=1172615 RepID=A0ABS5C796_9BACL|nr:Ger(x)C family spore germination protein [Paenibacillus lignilyticus]MBP3961773.1 Ger(x)C family spore germination protein [Paenibacillus lignilyticus]MBP3963556.1 Ger(x)C family spore germination protein [Paenibacillus lignilyticus]
MRRGVLLTVWILLCSMILTGCWDSQYLSTKKMVNGLSLDIAKDNSLMMTIRAIQLKSKGGGQFDVKDQEMQATGESTYSVGRKIDSMLPGTVEATKTHIIIVGEELAKQGLLAPLEYFYRNPKGYLNSNILISKGVGAEVLSFKKIDNSPIAFGIMQLIHGAVRSTVAPDQTLYSIWSQLFDPGEDMILPIIYKLGNKALVVDSVGLFDGDKYSGVSLSNDNSILLLLLLGKLNTFANLDIPIDDSLLTLQTRKMKRAVRLAVNKKTSEIEFVVKVDLYGVISSFPNHLGQEIDREQVKKEITEYLNKRAMGVTSKLQQANCDAFGIGRRLKAHHSKLWKTIDWKKAYKEVKIRPEVQVHIKSTGIIK